MAVFLSQQMSRPPVVLFKESLNHPEDANFCELLASSQWPFIKLKLPPTAEDPDLGWRIEVRPMEAQLTDFENAAFAVFIGLLARAMLAKRPNFPNFTLPMSKLIENMERSKKINAVLVQKFHFPTKNGDLVEISINEIINGDQGIVPMLKNFLNESQNEEEAKNFLRISEYLDLIQGRASGKFKTLAQWMREFVENHCNYQKNSVVSEKICYDLLLEMQKITEGKKCEKLGLINSFF